MELIDISTDILAVKCVHNYIFVGIGCTLHILNKNNLKLKQKIQALHPDNIHNIYNKDNKRLIVFGGKSLIIFKITINNDQLYIEKIGDICRFNEWIIDVQWLGTLENSILTILFAHNHIKNYNFNTKDYISKKCTEKCLLYAGTITGEKSEEAIVFAGTVFQEILIWQLHNCNDKSSDVMYRLKGHKGVIFSISYNSKHNIICSTSDDRTVRTWKIVHGSKDKKNDWKNVEINLQTTMYGHLARVWRSVILKDQIISIGEDSRVCFWTLDGNLLKKLEVHHGAPIWCIDVHGDDLYTGGGDGIVNSMSLNGQINSNIEIKKLPKQDSDNIVPKYVTIVDDNNIFVFSSSEKNSVFQNITENGSQKTVSHSSEIHCSSYCVIEVSLNKDFIAFGSINGQIILFKKICNANDNIFQWKQWGTYDVLSTKIFSIKWLESLTVLVCGAEGNLSIIKFKEQEVEKKYQFILPSSRERWVTAACMFKNFLFCGDRIGNIFVFKLDINIPNPVQIFKKIHGRLGVQSCLIIDSKLLTTGRDGTVKFYEISNENSENSKIQFLFAKNMPMNWVNKVIKYNDDYFVLGFKEEDFMIYSINLQQILVKIVCGGGHRSWDCAIYDKIIKFVYIQKKEVYFTKIILNSILYQPLIASFHMKLINCLKIISIPTANYKIFITGGEDCVLRINCVDFTLKESETNYKNIYNFDGHISTIKCLDFLKLSTNEKFNKYLIFSGGGRAQLKIWELSVNFSEKRFMKKNIYCKDLTSFMLFGEDQKRNKIWVGNELMYNVDPETRFMHIITSLLDTENKMHVFIFVACSDGYIRILLYDIQDNNISLIGCFPSDNRCILKLCLIENKNEKILISLATDGLLNFWNIELKDKKVFLEKILIDQYQNFSLHQSGINCCDIKILANNDFVLATGGDDNRLSIVRFKIIEENKKPVIKLISSWKNEFLHYAQITGIKFFKNKLCSVGADQKIIINNCCFNDSNISVNLVSENNSCISDVQGVEIYSVSKFHQEFICIHGKGFQVLRYDNDV